MAILALKRGDAPVIPFRPFRAVALPERRQTTTHRGSFHPRIKRFLMEKHTSIGAQMFHDLVGESSDSRAPSEAMRRQNPSWRLANSP